MIQVFLNGLLGCNKNPKHFKNIVMAYFHELPFVIPEFNTRNADTF